MSDKVKECQHCEVTGSCTLLMGLGRLTAILENCFRLPCKMKYTLSV